MRLLDSGRRLRLVGLAREAFALTFQGSRDDLAEVTARRVPGALLLLWLTARCVHLAQAGIDLAVGYAAYTPAVLALGLAIACTAESALVAAVMVRARQLTLGPLLCDAAFGVVGLAVMSITTSATHRIGSLNWMLPYTVATATGLGLLPAGFRQQTAIKGGASVHVEPATAGSAPASVLALCWRWPQVTVQVATVIGLAGAYLLSVYARGRLPAGDARTPWGNAANYVGFFLAATVAVVLLRRWLALISQRNRDAVHRAGELSRDALWRALTADVFGPVLELLDGLARVGDQVPEATRAEAGRLIGLIEEVRPRLAEMIADGSAGSDVAGRTNPP